MHRIGNEQLQDTQEYLKKIHIYPMAIEWKSIQIILIRTISIIWMMKVMKKPFISMCRVVF